MGVNPHTPSLGTGKCEKEVLPGAHILCQHAITDKMIASDARRDGRFYRPANRVCSPQEHSLCEHVLSGWPTDSFACRAGRLCLPIIRVRKAARAELTASTNRPIECEKIGCESAYGTDRFSRSILRVARLLDAVLPRPYTNIIQSF